jgi:NTP pyrophosphatase (non-canonical NTP hydrolase)
MPSSEELQIAYAPVEDSQKHFEVDAASDALVSRMRELEEKMKREDWDFLASRIHPTNVKNGFWGEPEMMDKYVAKLMLVVTEVAEVTEALRKGQGADKVTEEFADIFIRALDLYGVLVNEGEATPQLYGILLDKMEVNANRPPKHGNRWG